MKLTSPTKRDSGSSHSSFFKPFPTSSPVIFIGNPPGKDKHALLTRHGVKVARI